MNNPSQQRTLIVHFGGIGDFLLTCPTLALLARSRRITLVGKKERLNLGVLAGIAESAIDWNALPFDTLFSDPAPCLQPFIQPFDEAILWMKDSDTAAENLQRLGVLSVKSFPGLPPEEWNQHASLYYAQCLGFEEVPPNDWKINPSPLPHAAILHPGSGNPKKNWPLENFLDVAHYLENRGLNIWWTRGPAETDLVLPDNLSTLEDISLCELARCLAGAVVYVGNDSGISHLAAAVRCPTIAVFGPTDPKVWAPRGQRVTVLKGNPWPAREEVLRSLDKILALSRID
ncbi:MAG TPA: glycosyltransferase family 9 protein [Candidatus Hydrogenedentes bacterium]|nr:glycosyltransferase family 9 protein [Candidatus Hydrogenedentota bacterium]HOL75982.1 glycosyltransferase family 9 protein [Candidatus Hydrogenedentota bacterium]HPO85609.1 glycosyltransferase family 9 protein [Candidatus Hydrogenedentota bacterium]